MKKTPLLSLFALVCAAQFAVPAMMIFQSRTTLAKGAIYRFRTAPVDPYDAFRGRYVALSFEANTAPIPVGVSTREGQRVYATLGVDAEGFAYLSQVTLRRPAAADYLKVRVSWVDGDRVNVSLPFDRYYMPEDLAPEAERAYMRRGRSVGASAYADVSVHEGRAVLRELYLDGMPIADYVRLHAADSN